MPRKVIERFAFGVLADKDEYPEYYTHSDRFLIVDLKNRKEIIHREYRENPYAEICREKYYQPTAFGERPSDEEKDIYLKMAEIVKDCKYLGGKKFGYWPKELFERTGASTMMTDMLPQERLDSFITDRHFAGFRDDDVELKWQGKRVSIARENLCAEWQNAFYEFLKQPEYTRKVLESLERERLSEWAGTLTHLVIDACRGADWSINAKGRVADGLPFKPYSGYLDLDVAAFTEDSEIWQFPIAIFEVETQDYINYLCYDLWKVFCIHANLRVVFFFRKFREHHPSFNPNPEDVNEMLLKELHDQLIRALPADELRSIYGETLLIIGNKGKEKEFPRGYFTWLQFDKEVLEFIPFGEQPEPFPPLEQPVVRRVCWGVERFST